MNIIDFHAHVLPGVDDGSQSVAESLCLLERSAAQNVELIIATPHFYPSDTTPARFLKARDEAEKDLLTAMREREGDGLPDILPGAEVEYFCGMANCRELRELCIRGTSYLLIEMPFEPWSEMTLRDLFSLREKIGVSPVVAHIERYLRFQKRDVLGEILGGDILIQSNASFFIQRRTRERAIKMLSRHEIHLLGSDCHNMKTRCPNLGDAYAFIEKRCGIEMTERINRFSHRLIARTESK